MIKIIAVDLGGVYFESGTKIVLKQIYKIANAPKKKVDEIFKSYPKKEGELYHKGKITKQKFWNAAAKKLEVNEKFIPELQEIWHSSYKPIKGMKELVSELRKNYKVVAFSGNIKERIKYLNEKYKLNKDFDDFVLSFDVGFDKREKEFYRILLEKIKCKSKECLFVDDRQDFLNIAKLLGIKTIPFKNAEQLKFDLRKFGIKI
jgi:HAD superfamily hydrolase (TIGR01509 family)